MDTTLSGPGVCFESAVSPTDLHLECLFLAHGSVLKAVELLRVVASRLEIRYWWQVLEGYTHSWFWLAFSASCLKPLSDGLSVRMELFCRVFPARREWDSRDKPYLDCLCVVFNHSDPKVINAISNQELVAWLPCGQLGTHFSLFGKQTRITLSLDVGVAGAFSCLLCTVFFLLLFDPSRPTAGSPTELYPSPVPILLKSSSLVQDEGITISTRYIKTKFSAQRRLICPRGTKGRE